MVLVGHTSVHYPRVFPTVLWYFKD